ncbi:alanine racemase [Aeromicrobium fastidiosum]|uniref:Alanine racemase n=1 Tax=Aeromicrobium fastidiosum TaxID=52699 RepID=A0A641APE6_9ACTN|nr:alanine racemase [Aeromicrobium fastidiosum]KAA1379960.1 alanine racemase [Aeromicrobium fastidiosum]MBP2389473.1 alanine racemase [Aeromicrobium fastidiosum]
MTTMLHGHDTATTTAPVATVDLGAVAANTRVLAVRAGGELMAVVKADGFGHGAVPVARTALAHGATWLGVTSIVEAVQLREAGITAPVLSWLNPLSGDFATALRHRIDLAVPGAAHLALVAGAAETAGVRARVHLHLDVGMARDGASPAEWLALCRRAHDLERQGFVDVVGVMGHLGGAGEVADGLARFGHGVDVARSVGLRPRVRHLAATGALLDHPDTHLELCRVGAGLYGIDPTGRAGLRPTMTLTAPVVTVRDVAAGTPVGYGGTWSTPTATRLALLPLGYADGLPRAASGRAEVLLRGRRAPVVGTISMDQVVVDVGDLPVRPGDVAVVLGPGGLGGTGEPTAAEWAAWAGTIEHEILTGIGHRVQRVVR